jgi:hypothetical protein
MRDLYAQEDLAWLCAEDFNEILFQHEKEGGGLKPQSQMDRFGEAMMDCDLEDLGFEGDVFMWWNNHHRMGGYVRERLDWALANLEWRTKFPMFHVLNDDPRHSDHRPVIILAEARETVSAQRSNAFYFETAWIEEEKCEEVITEGWE